MASVKDAEYSGCLPPGRMCRNVEYIFGFWHESITIHKLGCILVYAVKFWHQIEFVTGCVKISALYADWWAQRIRIASLHIWTLRSNVRHSHFLLRGHYRWQYGISLPEVGREVCSSVKCLLMLVLMCMESCVMICGNKMPTRCNRGFYCRSYCLLNMFRAPLHPSSGAQDYYTVTIH